MEGPRADLDAVERTVYRKIFSNGVRVLHLQTEVAVSVRDRSLGLFVDLILLALWPNQPLTYISTRAIS
jgi:hypothetical protein